MSEIPNFLQNGIRGEKYGLTRVKFSGWYVGAFLLIGTQMWANREVVSHIFDGAFGFGHIRVATGVGEPTTAKAGVVTPPKANEIPQEQIEWLLQQGNLLLADGDISSARIYFRRAADGGSADAALSLGQTYDPLVLKQLEVVGMPHDIEQSRHWYNVAKDLGGLGGRRAQIQLKHLDKHD
jgi:TPR repeat protein